jgi:chemotaxis signal transduction protein
MATSSRNDSARESDRSAGEISRLSISVCAFRIGGRQFGIEVSRVGEVVHVERVTEVPAAPATITGIFGLRGTPIALVDLSTSLGTAPPRRDEGAMALVLRIGELEFALAIDAVDAVIPADRGSLLPRSDGDSAFVRGFVEVKGLKGLLTLLDPEALATHLHRMRRSAGEEDVAA